MQSAVCLWLVNKLHIPYDALTDIAGLFPQEGDSHDPHEENRVGDVELKVKLRFFKAKVKRKVPSSV